MSTVRRRRGQSLHLDLPNGGAEDLPSVAAVFLILFDVKAGYTIAWKQSISGLELNESVEYKSLPSGLHNVEEDLIYFVHNDDYAGISAFINEPAEESDRNALMLAVGALVPLSYGRLGKSWKHAVGLKELAKKLSKEPKKTELLEEFWNIHKTHDGDDSQGEASNTESPSAGKVKRRQDKPTPNGRVRTRKRAVTSASALAPPGQSLDPYHPALSLPSFLDTFGPLVFPIYKAALLRKRILLVGQAPVEQACNFVYDISILSGIPSSVSDLLPLEPLPTRLLPLFAVGVHDMSILAVGAPNQPSDSNDEDDGTAYGWVANTTDDILALKPHLYDTVITLPPAYAKNAKEKHWPRLEVKKGTEIKATQRDLRRYRTFRRELRRSHPPQSAHTSHSPGPSSSSPNIENNQETYDDASSNFDAPELVEPQSWSALAYNSFMWWASAGEKRTDVEEEEEYDAALLRNVGSSHSDRSPPRPRSSGRSPAMEFTADHQGGLGLEMRIIAYFHRLTTLILKTLADVIDASDSHSDYEPPSSTEQQPEPPQSNSDPNPSNEEDNPTTDSDQNTDTAPLLKPSTTTPPPPPKEKPPIPITTEDMSRMGLDIWSESDRVFLKELVGLYWGRRADVRGGGVECCGVRIC